MIIKEEDISSSDFFAIVQFYADIYYSKYGQFKSVAHFLETIPSVLRRDVRCAIELTEIEAKLSEKACEYETLKIDVKIRELDEKTDESTNFEDIERISNEIDKKFEIIERESKKFDKIYNKALFEIKKKSNNVYA